MGKPRRKIPISKNQRKLPPKIQMEVINKALETMTEKQRRAFIDYYFSGMEPADIAEKYGVGKSTICRHLNWAGKKVQKTFENVIFVMKEEST